MFELTILTIDGKKFTDSISRISLPTNDGIRTILANHMDVVVPIEIGVVRLIQPNEDEEVVVSQGIFYFSDNRADLFVRTFERASEIDEERAERAKERAEKKLADERLPSRELQETELALKRALTRLSTKN